MQNYLTIVKINIFTVDRFPLDIATVVIGHRDPGVITIGVWTTSCDTEANFFVTFPNHLQNTDNFKTQKTHCIVAVG